MCGFLTYVDQGQEVVVLPQDGHNPQASNHLIDHNTIHKYKKHKQSSQQQGSKDHPFHMSTDCNSYMP